MLCLYVEVFLFELAKQWYLTVVELLVASLEASVDRAVQSLAFRYCCSGQRNTERGYPAADTGKPKPRSSRYRFCPSHYSGYHRNLRAARQGPLPQR